MEDIKEKYERIFENKKLKNPLFLYITQKAKSIKILSLSN